MFLKGRFLKRGTENVGLEPNLEEGITGIPRSQETRPHWDPTVGLCLGPLGEGLLLMSEAAL